MSEAYLNGKFIGTVENPDDFVNKIREGRIKGNVLDNLNVYYDKKAGNIQMNDDKGRLRRPLIVVKNGQPLLTEDHIKNAMKKASRLME